MLHACYLNGGLNRSKLVMVELFPTLFGELEREIEHVRQIQFRSNMTSLCFLQVVRPRADVQAANNCTTQAASKFSTGTWEANILGQLEKRHMDMAQIGQTYCLAIA